MWSSGHRVTNPRFREVVFGAGQGILGLYLDQEAQLIRIFDVVWVG
jgi:hypothetical protein